jgi:hypothetical protein
MNDDVDHVLTSESSRRDARNHPSKQLEIIEKERSELSHKKKMLEYQMSEIEDWKRIETSKILEKRMNKTDSIAATTLLESRVREKKSPIVNEMRIIEKRMHDIKTTLQRHNQNGHDSKLSELIDVMLRIENMLRKHLEKTT